MTTIFLSYAFPPLQYPRAIQVARLAAHLPGRRIEVYGADEGTPGDPTPLAGMEPGKVAVHRLPSPVRPSPLRYVRGALRGRPFLPDPHRRWAMRAARHIAASHGLRSPGDVVVTFGQPMSDHLAGAWLKRRTGVRWIAHFSDPWVDNPLRRLRGPERWINRHLEAKVFRHADLLVFTSAQTVDLVFRGAHAPLGDKARVLPHAFDPSQYPEIDEPRGERLVLRYVGGFYGRRTPEPLLAALRVIVARSPAALEGVTVELIGSMPARMATAVRSADLPDGLVRILPRVDYRTSLAAMRSADVLLVIDAPAETSVFLPSKLVDYAGARRPMLGLTPEGAAADLLRRLGAPVVDPSHPVDAADALERLILEARNDRCMDRTAGYSEVLADYEASTVASAFAAMLEG